MPSGHVIGNKPFSDRVNVRNAESSSSIPAGSPVCLVISGTDDGFAVVLPATGAAAKATTLFFGVADRTMAANDYGMTTVFGWCNRGIFVQQSRAASTDSYASAAAASLGQKLNIDTVNNAFGAGAIGAQSDFLAFAVAAQTLASAASSASTSSDASVAKTYALKMFIRAM